MLHHCEDAKIGYAPTWKSAFMEHAIRCATCANMQLAQTRDVRKARSTAAQSTGLLTWCGLSPVRSSTFWMHTLSAVSALLARRPDMQMIGTLAVLALACTAAGMHATRESASPHVQDPYSRSLGRMLPMPTSTLHCWLRHLITLAHQELHQCTEYHSIASVWHSSAFIEQ